MLLDKQQCNNIVKLDEGYYIFHTIRNSPTYFETKKKDVMAMVHQLGICRATRMEEDPKVTLDIQCLR